MTLRAIALVVALVPVLVLGGCAERTKTSEKAGPQAARSDVPKEATPQRTTEAQAPPAAKAPAATPPATPTPAAPKASSAWSAQFVPPSSLDTDRIHLESLGPEHAKLDYAAFMSSRDHLHRTLHWGSWPREDATVEENERDLARHRSEFDERSAYAYTVLRRDRSACVGCVYLNPIDGEPAGVEMSWWVTEPEVASDLDEHLVLAVVEWLDRDWPFESVLVQVHTENVRGAEIARHNGFIEAKPTRPDHVALVRDLDD